MSRQHKELTVDRWREFPFIFQMANIGSEIERTLAWRAKNNPFYAERALERALELLELTLESVAGLARKKELCRVREALLDFFVGANEYGSTEESWRRYFAAFARAARKDF